MKKMSIIALFSVLSVPVFAADTDLTSVATVDSNVSANVEMTEAAKQELKNKFKDELKQEIKQELKDEYVAKHVKHKFPNGIQLGVGVSGTSGLNGFVGYANKESHCFWTKRFGVRFDFATTSPIKSAINNAINEVIGDGFDIGDTLKISDVDFKAKHAAALVDFYPFGNTWLLGGLRVTGGYFMGDMNIDAELAGTVDGLPAGEYGFELGGTQFKYVGNSVHGNAELDWDYRGPYVGTGFDLGLFAGFKIYLDAGVVFTNKAAELSLNVPVDNLYKLEGGTWASVGSIDELKPITDEVLADAQSELDDFKFYPMVKIGFMYRF